MRNMILRLVLISLVLCSPASADQISQIWNSSNRQAVTLTFEVKNGRRELVNVSWIESTDKKPINVQIISQQPGRKFAFKVDGKSVWYGTYLSPSDVSIKFRDQGNSYTDLWTLRGGKSSFPVPNKDGSVRSYWKTRSQDKGFQVLTGPDGISLTMVTSRNGKASYLTKRAKWIQYPTTFLIEEPIGTAKGTISKDQLKIGYTIFYRVYAK